MTATNTDKFINHQDGLDIVTALGSMMTHTDATNLISAVNALAGNATDIGTLSNLSTDDKSSLVAAINEVYSNVIADGAAAHNAIYRGKNLGTSVCSWI